ncbi:MAG: hypothetical protein JST12_14715 [Armatimonadetes bacterium]|nr:hypothetical protein [Armatimonadota bacterium]
MANPIFTIAEALKADVRDACGWDETVPVFQDNPRTQPSSRTYGIVRVPSLTRKSGGTSPQFDHYELTFAITIRLGDPSNDFSRLNLRTEVWLKLRAKLTPRPETNGGSASYHGGFSCLVTDGNLADLNDPEQPDTELQLTFQTTVKLERGVTNIT